MGRENFEYLRNQFTANKQDKKTAIYHAPIMIDGCFFMQKPTIDILEKLEYNDNS